MGSLIKHFYEFGSFRPDVANRLLLRDGKPLSLTPKAVETLLALVRHGGEPLCKDDLMRLVWPDSQVFGLAPAHWSAPLTLIDP